MSIHTSAMEEKSSNLAVLTAAERWYARLNAADCSASERMEFQRWRAAPEHAAAYAATEALWQSLGQLTEHPDLEQLSQQVLADTAQRPERPRRPAAIAAAILIALFGGGALLTAQNRGPHPVVYATELGERSIIKLADGSQLVLNSATQLDVRLGDAARSITLHQGEAIFTAAHDETRPFRVVAGDGEVTALGTRFQIRNDAGQVTVTLMEGRVSVERRELGERAQLEPGNQVRFAAATPQMVRRSVDPEIVTSWSAGRLRFRSTPLAEVLDEVNRYSTTRIHIADPALNNIPINGTFEIGDSSSVVAALEMLLEIRVTRDSDGTVQLQPR